MAETATTPFKSNEEEDIGFISKVGILTSVTIPH